MHFGKKKEKKAHFEEKSTKKHFSTTKKHYDEKKAQKTLLFFKSTCWEDCKCDFCSQIFSTQADIVEHENSHNVSEYEF